MIQDEISDEFKQDCLFVLVGTNPLPNYVAASLLAQENTVICLLSSGEGGTIKIADKLSALLRENNPTREVESRWLEDPADEKEIYNTVTELLRKYASARSIGINYTGGTKPMSVFAFQAIQDWCQPRKKIFVYSYLDPRGLRLRLPDNHIFSIQPINLQLQLETLISLHGRYLKLPKRRPILPDFCQNWAKRLIDENHLSEWRNWCDQNLRTSKGVKEKKNELIDVSLPDYFIGEIKQIKLAKWRATVESQIGWRDNNDGFKSSAKFLDGDWLESLVLDAIGSIKDTAQIHDSAMDMTVQIKEGEQTGEFQFDVAAMRGYQLYAFSCTTDVTKDLGKKKLFELLTRARQMGGDEARVALVTGYSDPTKLLQEVQEDWLISREAIRVFGPQDWLNLPQLLSDWFHFS